MERHWTLRGGLGPGRGVWLEDGLREEAFCGLVHHKKNRYE
jgi:hypothetical protein